jgi:pimeloyl-ACP methyl ester carboxylesterase
MTLEDRFMSRLSLSLFATALLGLFMSATHAADANERSRAPTIVLVHGAFADASSWNAVIAKLLAEGYPVIAVANPLRSLSGDSAYVSGILKTIPGPVILVGHSYGGSVISNAAVGNDNVKALVFVAAFAPEPGESALALSGKFPGATLGAALAPPVPLASGGNDLYVKQSEFRGPFAADLPVAAAKLAAATQRPATDIALGEPSRESAWKTLPSWFIYGSADNAIPAAAHAFMADRAKARRVQAIKGASHVVMISHPAEVAKMIREAATAATAASAS